MMNLDEIVTVTLKVLAQQEELNTRLQNEDQQEATNHILVRLTQLEEAVKSIQLSLKKPETLGDLDSLKDLKDQIEEEAQLSIVKPSKKRGPYKKKIDITEKTVVIKKGVSGNMFGTKTTSKYNKAITRAMKAKHFTPAQIIAEVKSKHASVNRFSGKELLYQIKKAKWRLDGERRREAGLGIYAKKAAKLNAIIENTKI